MTFAISAELPPL